MGVGIVLFGRTGYLVNCTLKAQEIFGWCVFVLFVFFSENLQVDLPDSVAVVNYNSRGSSKYWILRCRSVSRVVFSILGSRFKVE